MFVLVVNAGSSSLKVRLLDPADRVIARLDHGRWSGPERLSAFVSTLDRVDAVGHRIVHGGTEFAGPTEIQGDVRDRIAGLTELAPLHQPSGVAGIDTMARVLPGVPAVACFDTTFHQTLPAAATTYALPREWNHRFGLRRYGFHGLSHAYAARRAVELGGGKRIVSCHLGSGASLAAIRDGQSVDTTMGFTPLEGLVMATRPGNLDPGLVLYLLRHSGLSADELGHALEHKSGLAGLSGGSGDLRELDQPDVLAVYLHRLRREIAAMAASLHGLDTLVFTGGVGEHQPMVRAAAADGLGFLGVQVDPAANLAATSDADISEAGAAVRTLVVTAREDVEIARQTRWALDGRQLEGHRRRSA
jgi:acetate kinase